MAEKTDDVAMYNLNVENHHDYGISIEVYNKLEAQDYTDYVSAGIVNRSTKLIYKKMDMSDAMTNCFSAYDLRSPRDGEDDNLQDRLDAEDAMIRDMGFADDENIYAFPTVGISKKDIEAMESNVVEGEINYDAIVRGDEIILAVPEEKLVDIKQYIHINDTIPISDMELSEAEETYNFNNIVPGDYVEPSYMKEINMDGHLVPLSSWAFGKRKDIQTRVGAIVVINGMESDLEQPEASDKRPPGYQDVLPLLYEYMTSYGIEEGSQYGIYGICAFDTFSNWGLPDRLLTSINLKVKDAADEKLIDYEWYQNITNSKGISIQSTKELKDKAREIRLKNMSVYYMMMFLVLILGFITSAIELYSKMRMKGQSIAYLKTVGMTNRNMIRYIIRENYIYTVVGCVCSTLPVALCQLFFLYIRKINETYDGSGAPWYSDIPFWSNLYEYNLGFVLLAVFIFYTIVNVLAALPGFWYIRNQNIADELETNTF